MIIHNYEELCAQFSITYGSLKL